MAVAGVGSDLVSAPSRSREGDSPHAIGLGLGQDVAVDVKELHSRCLGRLVVVEVDLDQQLAFVRSNLQPQGVGQHRDGRVRNDEDDEQPTVTPLSHREMWNSERMCKGHEPANTETTKTK
jgi:hypothetical protein